MKHLFILITCILFFLAASLHADIFIQKIQGDVKVRKGLDETWQKAGNKMLLKNIDTILTGEDSEVILSLPEGITFTLGSQSILDIGDLREITERELFLFLTSQKIRDIENVPASKVHIENVSVVRAQNKQSSSGPSANNASDLWRYEVNGARAMHNQMFYPNAVMKMMYILKKYTQVEDYGLVQLYLGQSFEAMNQSGRALEAYQKAAEEASQDSSGSDNGQKILNDANAGIERVK